ncbi:MAG: hypothetical protein A3F82_03635 [Deltaproteobacteria bacterium RIFCSPLOWO2_12_FULL_44_12]|nr:MAG: hypothetical protein A2712_05605 [Deltaproteobacteria bacterium RIFCSPHIGHO2_01_FULL_43_49]OGQ14322.1 MAG: hypothetical protein A3D22_04780 [Deltaproteobacteria bacterium RIFCSPHIGHO2_02_FULL_44_53]OGQ27638.1 MAG: hypothetical protein A3D98_09395 [Deltaproteobacteria bacterium RIFCSPHIGHO2_12_FULL_44_21]OGQ30763.1 MAG: hypothetical protein A2979_01190 [Deltaproteobacteria bacterium RIFCSPLOWO2_01_FULL_45_74]OGQ42443.1 MAG: hypothetical protein A3I70_10715 [Deltaproteobacteria bacterium 
MKIFFGAAIQGQKNRVDRASVHKTLIECIKTQGFQVITEHTTGTTFEETTKLLEESIGPLPPPGLQRRIYVCNKMIEGVEGDIAGAVFEVSLPSLGTGIELAHAYLRPRLRLKTIPVLALYEKNFWPNDLSTMIRGITNKKVPHFHLKEYSHLEEAKSLLAEFLKTLSRP